MPNSIKQRFDKRFPNLIDSIKKYITKPLIQLTDDDEDDINEWWE